MKTKTTKLITIALGVATMTLTAGVVFSVGTGNNDVLKSNATDTYTVTFDSDCVRTKRSDTFNYAYQTSVNGTKYAAVHINATVDQSDNDVFVWKGSSNFIFFAFGDVESSGEYTQAKFNGGIKTVSIECKYVFTIDQSFYLRTYYSNTGSFDDDHKYSYKPTKDEYSILTYDFSTLNTDYVGNCKFLRLGVTNSNVTVYIKSITIEYGC